MWTLKFKSQPTITFFATANQMFGGSSQLTTTAEHCFVVWTVLNDLITARSKTQLENNVLNVQYSAEHLIYSNEKRICLLNFEFWKPHVIQKGSNPFYPVYTYGRALCTSCGVITLTHFLPEPILPKTHFLDILEIFRLDIGQISSDLLKKASNLFLSLALRLTTFFAEITILRVFGRESDLRL